MVIMYSHCVPSGTLLANQVDMHMQLLNISVCFTNSYLVPVTCAL